jgi:C1A family cysteine protease
MPEPDFRSINATIARAGAAWKSGRTSHSKYWGHATAPGNFGLSVDPSALQSDLLKARAAEPSYFKVTAPPPPRIDWRNHKGSNWITDIRDQGSCGACVAFATCAAVESRARIATNSPGAAIDLSEAQLFYCGTPNSCDVGWNFVPALKFARKGIGLEADFPYTPGNQACRKIKPAVKVKSHSAWSTTLARKQALQRGPVIGGLRVYEDFYTYSSGIYAHVAGNFVGLHAVTIIGYDDVEAYWIVKNSWGSGWGESGFLRIAYGECHIDSKFLFYEPDLTILKKSGLV